MADDDMRKLEGAKVSLHQPAKTWNVPLNTNRREGAGIDVLQGRESLTRENAKLREAGDELRQYLNIIVNTYWTAVETAAINEADTYENPSIHIPTVAELEALRSGCIGAVEDWEAAKG